MSMRRLLPTMTAALVAGALVGASPASAGPPPVAPAPADVSMVDNAFLPSTVSLVQGQGVEFENFGNVVHDAVDGTGLDLFATAYLTPSEGETIDPLPGSGDFRFYCTFHPGMVGRLRMPVALGSATVPRNQPVAIRWAPERLTGGLVVDVQLRRPGSQRFVAWRTGVTAAGISFHPTERGNWAFRARVRQPADGEASDWAPKTALQVT